MTYHTERHTITEEHELFEWCAGVCQATTNLRNAGRFRQRNIFTGLAKKPEERHELENHVISELEQTIPLMNEATFQNRMKKFWKKEDLEVFEKPYEKYTMLDEDHRYLDYLLLDGMMHHLKNPDYNNEYMGKNLAQRTLRTLDTEMDSFFKAIKSYAENPNCFSGKPEMPGYSRKGGYSTATFSNDGITVYEINTEKGKFHHYEMSLPKAPCRLMLRAHRPKGRVKEVHVVPGHNCFVIQIVTDDGLVPMSPRFVPYRIIAIDLGVDNFAAVVNNCGLPCLLFKGGVPKAINQKYNKDMARIQSEQTKGGEEKFVMTDEAREICRRRNDAIRDFIQKVSARIVGWCVENRIDTVVIGLNSGWKDSVNLGDKNTQNFVQLPYSDFIHAMEWRCTEAGIRVMTHEESYTSKASSQDEDHIPTFGDEKPEDGWGFSGYRGPTTCYYRLDENGELAEYKVKPRGLYKSRKHGVINSDLNGAANILRKVFAYAFYWSGCYAPDFSNVEVYKHPDYDLMVSNRKVQLAVPHVVSRSKMRRDIVKGRIATNYLGNPSGIGLVNSLKPMILEASPEKAETVQGR